MRLLHRLAFFVLPFLLLAAPVSAQQSSPQLSLLGSYETHIFDEGAAEIAAYDDATGRLFFVNADANEVVALDISDPANPQEIDSYSPSSGGGANSVAVAGGQVAVAVEADSAQAPGKIVFLSSSDLSVNAEVEVGALPDGVVFTPDGSTLVVAGEGEPSDDYTVDPLGTISVIDAGAYTETRLDFTAFNAGGSRAGELPEAVRIFGPGATVAQDLEPEFPTVSSDGSIAFVSLQENNATAVVDLSGSAPVIDRIDALGFKDHSLTENALDVNDEDGAINITTQPVRGLYQPDALAGFSTGGQDYVVAVNEGDAREYEGTPGYIEEAGLDDLLAEDLLDLDDDDTPDASIPAAFDGLAELDLTRASGDLDGDGLIEQPYNFGGRSFSILNADTGALVYESGDWLEQITAEAFPDNFNADNTENQSFDSRSDAKGPEPEAVTVGTVGGTPYLFVGMERIGGVAVFDASDPTDPQFVQYLNNRDFSVTDVEASVTGDGAVGDLGPESIVFIPADDNPNSSQDLVAVSNEVSGTVSLFSFAPPFRLQLLHATDLEAGVDAVGQATGRSSLENVGDAPRFSALVDAFRSARPGSTLVLSSGDNYIPGPVFSAGGDEALASLPNFVPAPGRADVAMMNGIGFDASALGNHEFDQGPDALATVIGADEAYGGTSFPYLSANLSFGSDSPLSGFVVDGAQPPDSNSLTSSVAIEMGGATVGVIGLTTPELKTISSPGENTMVDDDLVGAVQDAVDALEGQGIDKIILTSHLQAFSNEQQLAQQVSGVDIIVAGGSDRILADDSDRLRPGDTADDEYPVVETDADGNDVLLLSTDGQYRYLGRLVVSFNADGTIDTESIDAQESGAYAADAQGVIDETAAESDSDTGVLVDRVENVASAVAGVLAEKLGTTFGETAVFLNGVREEIRTQETNLGNLTADANLAYARQFDETVQVSFKNAGGIRAPIGAVDPETGERIPPPAEGPREEGQISQLGIENTLRFNNGLTVIDVRADSLLEALENGVSRVEDGEGRFPQIAGLRFSFDPEQPAGSRVQSAAVVDDSTGAVTDVIAREGAVVGDGSRLIRLVTLDFIVNFGGDGYGEFTEDGGAQNITFLTEQMLDDDLLPPGGDGVAGFGGPGSEQDALAEFLAAHFGDSMEPYDIEDTPREQDRRIQNLNFRSDDVVTPNAWVNEFHYDNDGADEGEFIEVAVPEGFNDRANMEVVLYNGSGSTVYDTQSLDAFTEGATDSTNGFTFYTYDFTANGGSIQNGSPDGFALCYQDQVVESGGQALFLSYEGTFTADGGCADGMTSTDIGVQESGDEAPGMSLQLAGGGRTYADLAAASWTGPVAESPGALNDGQTLPVEVVAFQATAEGDAVVLTWETASETGNAGFRIQQKRLDGESARYEETGAGLIEGAGTTQEAQQYRYRLDALTPGRYRFRLRQIDRDGTPHLISLTAEAQVSLEEPYHLSKAYPNPFQQNASLDLRVRQAQDVTVEVYDVLGRRVKQLFDGRVTPERPKTFTLKATDLASGIYLWRVQGETFRETRRVVLVR